MKKVEKRYYRVVTNYWKKTFVKDTDNTYYDYQNQNGVYISELLRLAHSASFNCLYSFKNDIFTDSIKPLSKKSILYKTKMFLKNDEEIFEDVLSIL